MKLEIPMRQTLGRPDRSELAEPYSEVDIECEDGPTVEAVVCD
jgi:hypothetical protein